MIGSTLPPGAIPTRGVPEIAVRLVLNAASDALGDDARSGETRPGVVLALQALLDIDGADAEDVLDRALEEPVQTFKAMVSALGGVLGVGA